MKTYTLVASESWGVTYEIKARSKKHAEDIYNGYEVGDMVETRKEGVEFFPVSVDLLTNSK